MAVSRGAYRSVYSILVDDPDFHLLSAPARLTLLIARICPQAGPAGIFRYYPELLALQTGLGVKQVVAALGELEATNWVYRDGPCLWVRNALRYDPSITLGNDNHRAAVKKWLSALPKVALVLRFCDYYKLEYPSGWDAEAIRDGIPHPTVIKEPDPEPDPEPELPEATLPRPRGEDATPPSRLTPEHLIDLFNELTPDRTPAVVTRSPERLRKARQYLAKFPGELFWRETFTQMHRSDFLRGLSKRTNGHDSFVADFDWLMSKGKDGTENAVKVHDGRYRNGT